MRLNDNAILNKSNNNRLNGKGTCKSRKIHVKKAKTAYKGVWRKMLHPIILLLIRINRIMCRQRIRLIGNKWDGKTPVIFAISHLGRYDYQVISEVLKVHQIPFSGDPEKMYGTFDGFILWLNGILYCDTDDKTDRKKAFESALKIVKDGYNLLIYPEGIWNLTASIPILPLFPGVIKISMETQKSIVPVAIEQYGKSFIVNIGERFEVNAQNMSDQEKNIFIDQKRHELREIMVSLKWEIYEAVGYMKRKKIGNYEKAYRQFRNRRLNEWCDKKGRPYYDDDTVQQRIYREQ